MAYLNHDSRKRRSVVYILNYSTPSIFTFFYTITKVNIMALRRDLRDAIAGLRNGALFITLIDQGEDITELLTRADYWNITKALQLDRDLVYCRTTREQLKNLLIEFNAQPVIIDDEPVIEEVDLVDDLLYSVITGMTVLSLTQ